MYLVLLFWAVDQFMSGFNLCFLFILLVCCFVNCGLFSDSVYTRSEQFDRSGLDFVFFISFSLSFLRSHKCPDCVNPFPVSHFKVQNVKFHFSYFCNSYRAYIEATTTMDGRDREHYFLLFLKRKSQSKKRVRIFLPLPCFTYTG